MCSADTEHLHPSKVTVQLGEWLQEKWFFCPISLIFCISSKLTAQEWFDFKLLFWKNGDESLYFFFSTNDLSKIFCIIFSANTCKDTFVLKCRRLCKHFLPRTLPDIFRYICSLQWYNMYATCVNHDDLRIFLFLIYILY